MKYLYYAGLAVVGVVGYLLFIGVREMIEERIPNIWIYLLVPALFYGIAEIWERYGVGMAICIGAISFLMLLIFAHLIDWREEWRKRRP